MKLFSSALIFVLLVSAVSCARSGEPESGQHAAPLESTLVGQVLLPSGTGSRGVEVVITESGDESRLAWVLFDDEGRFAHNLQGGLTSVKVTAGPEVHRIESENLPEANHEGQVDVGVIDLRDRLTEHRLRVRAAEGKRQGDVRVGMWFGPPPVGPQGEPVSLGSRQFPPSALGSELRWLVPNEAHSIYFLVERPSSSGRLTEWRGGHQRLFGPFSSAGIPDELIMD